MSGYYRAPAGYNPAVEVWRKTLAQVSTHFGRLLYLSSLRDTESGRYTHDSLLNYMNEEEADRTIRHTHHQVFQQWLAYSLSDQKEDLDRYLLESNGPRYSLPYRNAVPPTARDVERQLYLTDLETLLELLRFEHGAAGATPRA